MRKYFIVLAFLLPVAALAQQGGQIGLIGPNGNPATVNGNNELRVNTEGSNLFQDTFFIFDVVKNWISQSAGGGVAAVLNGSGAGNSGSIGVGSGTTGNGYSCVITNKPIFNPLQPGFLTYGFRIQVPTGLVANQYGFWGVAASLPASPTATVPFTEAIGFEISTVAGVPKLQIVSYAVGTGRTLIQDLSSTGTNKQPTDGGTYTWYLAFRPDKFNFALTDQDNIIASATGAVGPNNNSLKPVICSIAASTPPVSSLTLTVPAVFVGDNGHNSQAISDGLDMWLKGSVKLGSAAPLPTDNPVVVTNAPYTYTNITTDTTTVVKSGAGFLHTICFNTPVATEVTTIFDNTAASGTKIGTWTTPASPVPSCIIYDAAFATGLTLQTATAAGDLTVNWR